ncbi:MAG: CHAT domain-containing protein [Hyphomicrobiaceae bacterium]
MTFFLRAGLVLSVIFILQACAGTGVPSLPSPDSLPSSSQAALVAGARAKDAESAAYIATSGRLLYQSDPHKRRWGKYCALSTSLSDQGEFRRAVRAASKAFFLGKSTGNNYAKAYAARDLAYAYSLAGDLDTAMRWATSTLTYLRAAKGREKWKVRWRVYKVIGDIELRRGNTASAIASYEKALRQARDENRLDVTLALANAAIAARKWESAEKHFATVAAADLAYLRPLLQRGKAKLAHAMNKPSEALALYAKATQGGSAKDAYHRVWAFRGAGRAHASLGQTDQALESYNKAIATASQLRGKFRSEEFKTGFFGNMQDVFEEAIALSMSKGRTAQAFEISEQARARAMLDLIRGRVSASGKGKGKAIVDPVGRPLTAAAIQKALPANVTVVSYYVAKDRTFVWKVSRNGISAKTVRIGSSELTRTVNRFRKLIESKSPQVKGVAQKLYAKLVAPVRIPDKTTIAFVPHKTLNYVPFQALRSSRGWLIERHAVVTVPSASAIPALIANAQQSPGVLALGNPDLGDAKQALPGAELEVKQIATAFPSARTYVQKTATKKRLVEEAPSSGIVHIAAHASVDELDPLYSVIRLAPTNGLGGDMEAHEFYRMPLHRTKLVVLSACDSGLGRISRGDEFWGFKRTLLGSGARANVLSLWPVYDASTAKLMSAFYQRMNKQPLSSSLREAQLSLIRSKEFAHPVHWAPFVLVGNPAG